jgi:two-component system sensor histidine kinase RegB
LILLTSFRVRLLGIFIARTLLERTGAKVSFSNRIFPDHGAVVQIAWPRDRFEADEPAGGTEA